MKPVYIDANYFVSPQISVDDINWLAETGFVKIICNRPDGEVSQDLKTEVIGASARAAGLTFDILPLTQQTMHAKNIKAQLDLVSDVEGAVLAYCATGTRCTVVWALSQSGRRGADEILKITKQAGYNLEGLRPHLL